MFKFPDIKASSLVVVAGAIQSVANIAFLSVCAKSYGASEYALIPLYFTLQGLTMIFCYQGMDSMINRAMLSNHVSFFKTALKKTSKFAFISALILLLGLAGYAYLGFESKVYLILYLLLILQMPIIALEKIECALLGLNRFRELIFYKVFSSLISIVPLIASLFHIEILWIIFAIFVTRTLVTISSVIFVSRIIKDHQNNENFDPQFYISESQKMSYLAAFSTGLNYIWPLILFKIDPISLSLYFNGNKIPEKVKDYSKLFVSIPSQHWLKKGKDYFNQKIESKGMHIFGASLLMSGLLIASADFYIPLLFGNEYQKSAFIAQVLLMSVPARVLSAILQSREVFHEADTSFFRKSNYIVSVFNLILAVPMVYYFKEVGLAFHNLIMSYASYFISLLRFKKYKTLKK